MKTKITYLFAFLLLIVIGCDDREIDDFQNNENNTLQVSVSVPEETPATRSIENPNNSKDIIVKLKANETLNLYFKQGSTIKEVENVLLTNVSNDGKKANFEVKVPEDINATQPYTLYGVYGTSSKVKDGKPVADVTTRTAELINGKSTMKVPMYFKQAINGNMPNITFKHLGAMLVYTARNNTSSNLVKPDLAYLRASRYERFPYYLGTKKEPFNLEQEKVVSTQPTNGFGFQQFLSEQVEKATTNFNAGGTMTMVQWVSPKQFSGRKPLCQIYFITGSAFGSVQAPQMQRGRAYHIGLTYSKDSNNKGVLAVNSSDATTPGKMTIRISDNDLKLRFGGGVANGWIDLNANGVKDEGESIASVDSDWHNYWLSDNAQGLVTIYGKVTYLGIVSWGKMTELEVKDNPALEHLIMRGGYIDPLTKLDVSQNVNLRELRIKSEKLTKLDVSKNTKLQILEVRLTKLKTLDITNNKYLSQLIIPDNQLTELDISKHKRIEKFNVAGNKLTKLNIANGNNANFTECDVRDNPNLTCIKVDKDFVPNATTWKKDATASWNNTGQECGAPGKLVFESTNKDYYVEPTDRDKCRHTYYIEGTYLRSVKIKNIGVEPVKVTKVEIDDDDAPGRITCSTPLNFTLGANETKDLVFVIIPKKTESNDEIRYEAKIKTEDNKQITFRGYLGVDEKLEGKVTNGVNKVLNGSTQTVTLFGKTYYYKKEYVDTDKDGIISVREAREYKGALVLWINDWGNNDKNPFKYFTNITTLGADFEADWQRLKYLENLKRVAVRGPYEHLAKALWRNGKDGIKKVEEMWFYVTDDGNDDYGTLDKDEFPSLKKWWSHGYRYPDKALAKQLVVYQVDGSPIKTTSIVKKMTNVKDLKIKACPRLKKFYLPTNYTGAGITIKVENCPNIEKIYIPSGVGLDAATYHSWGITGTPDIVHY